jgi:predicted RNA binding protein YcfA (HicA-like mRNA interferase family)
VPAPASGEVIVSTAIHSIHSRSLTSVYKVRTMGLRCEGYSGMNSREVIKALARDGWYEVNQGGSHKQFKHPKKKGRVTVPDPRREIPIGTLKSIEKQAGIKLK